MRHGCVWPAGDDCVFGGGGGGGKGGRGEGVMGVGGRGVDWFISS